MGTVDYEELALRIGQVFRPGTPVDSEDLFFGRRDQVRRIVDAINQAGCHAIMYGEPGVGKTSLAKILSTKLKSRSGEIIRAHVNCDSGDSFQSVWSKVFSEISVTTSTPGMGYLHGDSEGDQTVADSLKEDGERITPYVVQRVLAELGKNALVYVVIDEFDKIPKEQVRARMADTIKAMSDRSIPATLIIVGVADDVNGLIQNHRSVERCLTQVHMPRMSPGELQQTILGGLDKVGMQIEDMALGQIIGLSKGLPHYAHLLSLHSGRQALDNASLKINSEHVERAISTAIDQVQESIRNVYSRATHSTKKDTLHEKVLLACSMCKTNEFGWFSPTDVAESLYTFTGTKYTNDRFSKHLIAFCDSDKGPALRREGGEYHWRYRFDNPLVQPYVLLKGLSSGAIKQSDLKLEFDSTGQGRMFG